MKEISPWRIQRIDAPRDPEAEYVYTSAVEQEAHLRDYWKIVVKRRRLVALIVLAVVGIAAYVTFTATPMFTATSMLKIEAQNPTVTGVPEVYQLGGAGPYDYYQTEFTLLQSRVLAAKVITDLGLDSNESFTTPSVIISSNPVFRIMSVIFGNLQYVVARIASWIAAPPEKTQPQPVRASQTPDANSNRDYKRLDSKAYRWVGRYLIFLKIKPVKGTRLVELQFTTPDPALSQLLADAHARAFIRMSLETRSELIEPKRVNVRR